MAQQAWMKSPYGYLTLTCSDRALTAVGFVVEELIPSLQAADKVELSDNAILKQARMEILQWCRGCRQAFDVPFEFSGTAFQEQVWLALTRVDYGMTLSYSSLASMIGRPDAVRAVANAIGANPLPIIVPCHRIIETSGGLGGYLGGKEMKQQLLQLERQASIGMNLSQQQAPTPQLEATA